VRQFCAALKRVFSFLPSPDYSRARTTTSVENLNLSLKIEISDFHVFQHYVSLKFPFSAKSSAF
jgi:hypothetical protein